MQSAAKVPLSVSGVWILMIMLMLMMMMILIAMSSAMFSDWQGVGQNVARDIAPGRSHLSSSSSPLQKLSLTGPSMYCCYDFQERFVQCNQACWALVQANQVSRLFHIGSHWFG